MYELVRAVIGVCPRSMPQAAGPCMKAAKKHQKRPGTLVGCPGLDGRELLGVEVWGSGLEVAHHHVDDAGAAHGLHGR
jgi:hypothetical protein